MRSERIYVAVVLEPDQDWPIADIVYDGRQWASATMLDGDLRVSVYGEPGSSATPIPIEDAISSLQEAKQQLEQILGEGGPGSP